MVTERPNEISARVFVSYARADGEAYAKYLNDQLIKHNISCWWDRNDLRRTNNWWRKIDQALDSIEYLVAVLTPKILNSETCRKEWQWARRKGKCIVPVKAGMSFEERTVPRWLKRTHAYQALDLNQKEPATGSEWTKFISDLNTTPKVEKVPFMADNLPEDFVARPEEFNKLLAMVIDTERSEPIAITAALRGAGGYGKTTLAKALCHDLRVQEAFDDGILWVTLGKNPENLTGSIRDCIQAVSGERPDFADERAAAAKLAELLDGRDVLLVIDDVWQPGHLEPFLQGSSCCARLVTTRISHVLPKSARKQPVDAMKTSEAAQLLSAGLDNCDPKQFADLAAELGEWPLLIKLVNRYLFDRVETGQPIADAIRFVSRKLKRHGLIAFDAEDADQRNDAVSKTVKVSLDLLDPHTQVPRLFELGIFPEDEHIPLEVVISLWQQTGGTDEIAGEELCERFFKLSLLLDLDLRNRTLRLHDAFRNYFRSQLRDSRIVHDHLLKSWTDPYALPNPYASKWYGFHVSSSSDAEPLRVLLTDFKWLNAKLNSTDVNSLLAEFKYAGNKVDSLRLIESAIRLSAHVLATDKEQLASQLLGRLPSTSDDSASALRAGALEFTTRAWLEPARPSLQSPTGPLIRILQGHAKPVRAIILSQDSRTLFSGSGDKTIKVWDLNSGECLRTLEGHSNLVSALAISHDGRTLISGSWDKTIKLWDLNSGECLRTLEGHSDCVNAVALSKDGCILVSGSRDNTIKIWDLNSGSCMRTLEGHLKWVNAVALSPDGCTAVSSSRDKSIKVWNLDSGSCLRTLDDDSDPGAPVTLSQNGRTAVSSSWDDIIKLWDLNSGECLRTIEDNLSPVTAFAISDDGRTLICGSWDKTINLWDLDSGNCLRTLEGHSDSVNAVDLSQDGRILVSGSDDQSIKIWDLASSDSVHTLEGHSDSVNAFAVSQDPPMFVSASWDKTIKLWDPNSDSCMRSLEGHSSSVNALAMSQGGHRLVSGSWDKTIKVWDLNSGDCLRTLEGHSNSVNAVALSQDSCILVSGSSDKTIKVWDLNSGDCLRTLEGHSALVNALAISHDGHTLFSGSGDKTIKVWDLNSGDCLRTMEGHSDSVHAVDLSQDSRTLVSGSRDRTIKVWDLTNDAFAFIASFVADAPVKAVKLFNAENIIAGDEGGQVHRLRLRIPTRHSHR